MGQERTTLAPLRLNGTTKTKSSWPRRPDHGGLRTCRVVAGVEATAAEVAQLRYVLRPTTRHESRLYTVASKMGIGPATIRREWSPT